MLSHPAKHMQERRDTPKQTGKQRQSITTKTKKGNADKMTLKGVLEGDRGREKNKERKDRELDEGASLKFVRINAHSVTYANSFTHTHYHKRTEPSPVPSLF